MPASASFLAAAGPTPLISVRSSAAAAAGAAAALASAFGAAFGAAAGDARPRPGADRGHHARGGGPGLEDVGHPEQGELLAVAAGALRAVLAATLDEGDRLFALDLVDHLGLDARALDEGGADRAADHEDIVELNLVAGIGRQFFHAEHVARLDPVLLAAGLEDRKHLNFLLIPAFFGPGITGVVAIAACEQRALAGVVSEPVTGATPSGSPAYVSERPGSQGVSAGPGGRGAGVLPPHPPGCFRPAERACIGCAGGGRAAGQSAVSGASLASSVASAS